MKEKFNMDERIMMVIKYSITFVSLTCLMLELCEMSLCNQHQPVTNCSFDSWLIRDCAVCSGNYNPGLGLGQKRSMCCPKNETSLSECLAKCYSPSSSNAVTGTCVEECPVTTVALRTQSNAKLVSTTRSTSTTISSSLLVLSSRIATALTIADRSDSTAWSMLYSRLTSDARYAVSGAATYFFPNNDLSSERSTTSSSLSVDLYATFTSKSATNSRSPLSRQTSSSNIQYASERCTIGFITMPRGPYNKREFESVVRVLIELFEQS
ncbi:hypothetical protein DPMN_124938 [Dreissena polymorpha]|uniref:Uncharacterized protein n=1 Tax=Dreissena polymorpha TaxID=45954 RepID=A0A9D4GXA4_DREPO|nr:hypothetical protein DPMN_124938 [Dreissena polymorpha]